MNQKNKHPLKHPYILLRNKSLLKFSRTLTCNSLNFSLTDTISITNILEITETRRLFEHAP